jgi:hypothetical protein
MCDVQPSPAPQVPTPTLDEGIAYWRGRLRELNFEQRDSTSAERVEFYEPAIRFVASRIEALRETAALLRERGVA